MDLFVPGIPLGYTWGRLGNFMNAELYGRVTDAPWGMYFYENAPLRHPSQLYEAFFEGIFLSAVLWSIRKKAWPPGYMTSFYIFGYGFVRFFIEFFRQPDKQFRNPGDSLGTVLGFMTMGQVLCLLMMVASGCLLVYFYRTQDRSTLR